jgi:hypothetical protein
MDDNLGEMVDLFGEGSTCFDPSLLPGYDGPVDSKTGYAWLTVEEWSMAHCPYPSLKAEQACVAIVKVLGALTSQIRELQKKIEKIEEFWTARVSEVEEKYTGHVGQYRR